MLGFKKINMSITKKMKDSSNSKEFYRYKVLFFMLIN